MKLTDEQLDPVIAEAAETFNVPAGLIGAVIACESAGNTLAIRYEAHYRWLYCGKRQRPDPHPQPFSGCSTDTEVMQQRTSWGLMQVMGAVAREYGYQGAFLGELLIPATGVRYGTRHLAHLAKRFYAQHGWAGVIAAFNAGSPQITGAVFRNQRYVDKVQRAWRNDAD